MAIATFAGALKSAVEQLVADPLGAPLIPNWARVLSAVPEAEDLLLEAVVAEGGILNGRRPSGEPRGGPENLTSNDQRPIVGPE